MHFPMKKLLPHSWVCCGIWRQARRRRATSPGPELLAIRFESVSDSANCEQMPGARRIVFDITAQADDEVVNGAGVSVFAEAPDLIENWFSRDDPAAIANQMTKEFGFHDGQACNRFFRAKFQIYEINRASLKRELVQLVLAGNNGHSGR